MSRRTPLIDLTEHLPSLCSSLSPCRKPPRRYGLFLLLIFIVTFLVCLATL